MQPHSDYFFPWSELNARAQAAGYQLLFCVSATFLAGSEGHTAVAAVGASTRVCSREAGHGPAASHPSLACESAEQEQRSPARVKPEAKLPELGALESGTGAAPPAHTASSKNSDDSFVIPCFLQKCSPSCVCRNTEQQRILWKIPDISQKSENGGNPANVHVLSSEYRNVPLTRFSCLHARPDTQIPAGPGWGRMLFKARSGELGKAGICATGTVLPTALAGH